MTILLKEEIFSGSIWFNIFANQVGSKSIIS